MAHLHSHPADPAVIPGHEPTTAQANAFLMEEIRILRERGLSDECIHGLFSGFHIDARPEPTGPHWNLPLNDQLIRLIWGRAHSAQANLD